MARPHVLPSTFSTASASATFPISWLTPNTPHDCWVRLVAPSPEAHAALTTWRALPLPPAFLKYIRLRQPEPLQLRACERIRFSPPLSSPRRRRLSGNVLKGRLLLRHTGMVRRPRPGIYEHRPLRRWDRAVLMGSGLSGCAHAPE